MSKRTLAPTGVELPSNLWHWLERTRFRSREECRNGPRPCPCISCEYHLLYRAESNDPQRWEVQPLEIHEMSATCRLDIIEQREPTNGLQLNSKPLPPPNTTTRVVIAPRASSDPSSPNDPSSR